MPTINYADEDYVLDLENTIVDLSNRVAALEQSGGGDVTGPDGQIMPKVFESTTRLVSRLYVEDVAPYKVVCETVIPELKAGQTVICYAENHVDPRQNRREGECAIVTGIYVDHEGWVAKAAGQDSYYAQKTQSPRIGVYVSPYDFTNVKVQLQMRALNKYEGGYANISWVKVGCIVI